MSNSEPSNRPLTDKAELVTVVVKVLPLPGHPQYWELKSALLYLWLYADSREGAIATAEQVFGALPYERVGDEFEVFEAMTTHPQEHLARSYEFCAQLAKGTGLSLYLAGAVVGVDWDFDFPLTRWE
jgi:hypothetical protein